MSRVSKRGQGRFLFGLLAAVARALTGSARAEFRNSTTDYAQTFGTDVTFGSTSNLVTWTSYYSSMPHIVGRIVTDEGPTGQEILIDVCEPPVWSYRASSAWDGTDDGRWLVMWDDAPGGYPRIFGRFVYADGSVSQTCLDLDDLHSTTLARPSVAFNGTDFLVAWVYRAHPGDADIYATRVTRDGYAYDLPPIRWTLS